MRLVPEYRVYTVDEDGHFADRVDIVCPDDEFALKAAKQFADGHAAELWEGGRFIAGVGGDDEKAE
jgi:hypothetical protein